MIKKTILIWNTVRYLKPIQIYWRIWLRFYRPKPNLSVSPKLRRSLNDSIPALKKKPSLELPYKFTFLNETHCLELDSDWNNAEWGKLWLYNLHYFDDLNALDSDMKVSGHRQLIEQWINQNPPATGNGWEPYPISLRVVNWIKWARRDNKLESSWIHNLAIQVRYLRNQLEFHLLGNHLLANAKALVFAGLYFEDTEASEWLSKGLEILAQELPEQILDDGGHFELSPMYHCIILEDLLDLISLDRSYNGIIDAKISDSWEGFAEKMLTWLQLMIHPDGEIALFNDAAFSIASKPSALFDYADRLDIKFNDIVSDTKLLSDSGYAHVRKGAVLLLADVGKIGPDYLPGHAHADSLSFELSLFGKRVIVDSGTSCYGHSEERLRQRSTCAHNTVEVNESNSSEVWGGFRVARRGYPKNIHLTQSDKSIQITASHDGFNRFGTNVIHQRNWNLEANRLIIEDQVTGKFDLAQGRLFFSPDVVVERSKGNNSWLLLLPNNHQINLFCDSTKMCIEDGTYHPEFGQSLNTKCLIYTVGMNQKVTTTLYWRE